MTVGTWRTVSVNGSVGEVVVTMLCEAGPYRASAQVGAHVGEAESTCARLAVYRALTQAGVLSELAEVLPPGVPSREEALVAMRRAAVSAVAREVRTLETSRARLFARETKRIAAHDHDIHLLRHVEDAIRALPLDGSAR